MYGKQPPATRRIYSEWVKLELELPHDPVIRSVGRLVGWLVIGWLVRRLACLSLFPKRAGSVILHAPIGALVFSLREGGSYYLFI